MLPEKVGRYEIKSELGRGGMATVYLAFDPRFKREVAIKILPPQLLADPVYRARFEREAQTIAALEHPAIVPVYDFGEEDGQLYLVMRYMPGGSLADKLKDNNLPAGDIAHIIARITSALDQVHARGIIHRDLKPGNILFDQYGEAYLSDFGIARLTEASNTLTGSAIVGTPAYMSPEQARGDTDIDGRTDLYAVGAILFQMLSGKLPFESTTPMGVAMKHLTEPVPSIVQIRPDLPINYDRVIETAMAKNRAHRFQTGQELARAVEAVTEEYTSPSRVTSPQHAVSRPATPSPVARPVTPPPQVVVSPRPATPASQPASIPSSTAQPPKTRGRIPWYLYTAGGLVVLAICLVGVFGIRWAVAQRNKLQSISPTETTVIAVSSLPYLDEFNDPSSGWPTYSGDNGQSGYDSGGYKIQVNAPDQQITANPGKHFTDVAIEFEATQLAGPEDAYFGALCRYQDDKSYYYLIIGADGYYSIGKMVNGENVPLSEGESSPYILRGQSQNSLRAECTSNILALYANGALLAQIIDTDYASGDVGLLAGTLSTPGVEIRFTNFYVTQP